MSNKNVTELKEMQEQLDDPDAPVIVVAPAGTFDVWETITVPPRKVLHGYQTTLIGHVTPVILVQYPCEERPVEGFTINIMDDVPNRAVSSFEIIKAT